MPCRAAKSLIVLPPAPGVLVVDDQHGNVAQGIVDRIASVTDQPCRVALVNPGCRTLAIPIEVVRDAAGADQ